MTLRVEQHRCGDPLGHVIAPSSLAASGDNRRASSVDSVDPTMSLNRIVALSMAKKTPPS